MPQRDVEIPCTMWVCTALRIKLIRSSVGVETVQLCKEGTNDSVQMHTCAHVPMARPYFAQRNPAWVWPYYCKPLWPLPPELSDWNGPELAQDRISLQRLDVNLAQAKLCGKMPAAGIESSLLRPLDRIRFSSTPHHLKA